ncbi:hypothetical protein GCM10023089_29040 [Quisquiliibacterium transsilvanicum]
MERAGQGAQVGQAAYRRQQRTGEPDVIPAVVMPAIHREPDGSVLLVYPCGRRLRILLDGRVEGLSPTKWLLVAALRVIGYVCGRRCVTRRGADRRLPPAVG